MERDAELQLCESNKIEVTLELPINVNNPLPSPLGLFIFSPLDFIFSPLGFIYILSPRMIPLPLDPPFARGVLGIISRTHFLKRSKSCFSCYSQLCMTPPLYACIMIVSLSIVSGYVKNNYRRHFQRITSTSSPSFSSFSLWGFAMPMEQAPSDLNDLKLIELRDLYRGLGGKPGTLRKSSLIERCVDLMAAASPSSISITPFNSSVASNSSSSVSSNGNGGRRSVEMKTKRRTKARNLPCLPTNNADFDQEEGDDENKGENDDGRERGLQIEEEEEEEAKGDGEAIKAKRRPRFPIGSNRDQRLDALRGNSSSQSNMEISFLGTASCIPSTTRGVSSMVLRYNSDSFMFDCGEASQIQIQRSRVKPSKIKKIFITHNHGDHAFGLPGMLCLIGMATQAERNEAADLMNAGDQGDEPLEIYGPEGTRDMVRAMLQLSYSRIAVPHVIHELKGIPFLHGRFAKQPPPPMVRTRLDPYYKEVPGGRDIYPNEQGFYHLFEDDELLFSAAPMQHNVPCVGYVVQEKTKV